MRSITITILIAALILAATYYFGILRFNYPSPTKFPIQGIDVSHHQGQIDWYQASLNGVQFAYIKATEGSDFKDPSFTYNWMQSQYSDIPHGAYHFFSFCRPGREQARNFLAMVPRDAGALPPALDLEFSGNCGKTLSRAAMIKEVTAFVAAIRPRFPKPPVFYVTPEFYKQYLEGHEAEYPAHRLWIRNVIHEPSQKPCQEWSFWQYASRGRIPGIRGPVDLNTFCGNAELFAILTSSTSIPSNPS